MQDTTTPVYSAGYSTDGGFQMYVMDLFQDYINSSSSLQEFLLSTAADGRRTTLTREFKIFYQAFLRLYLVTLPKMPVQTEEETKIKIWFKKSRGILSNPKEKRNLAHFAQNGCNIANEWVRLLYDQQIIKTTRL